MAQKNNLTEFANHEKSGLWRSPQWLRGAGVGNPENRGVPPKPKHLEKLDVSILFVNSFGIVYLTSSI